MYTLNYDFNPGDTIYVQLNNTIQEGTCMQANIQLINNSANTLTTTITYLVLLKCESGTISVDSSNAYSTLSDALTALGTYLSNLTCPTTVNTMSLANKYDRNSLNDYTTYEKYYCDGCQSS